MNEQSHASGSVSHSADHDTTYNDGTAALVLRLWNGTTLSLGNAGHDNPRPPFTLVCRHPSVVRTIVLGRDPLRLAEAYF